MQLCLKAGGKTCSLPDEGTPSFAGLIHSETGEDTVKSHRKER